MNKVATSIIFGVLYLLMLSSASADSAVKGLNGWEFVYKKLVEAGVKESLARELLTDPRMPAWEAIPFNPKPQESKVLYRKHNTKANRSNAISFYDEHYEDFRNASETYHVPSEVILSILQVESHCGKFTGRSSVWYRLARLVEAGSERNVNENYKRLKKAGATFTKAEVKKRGEYLVETFLPHLVATIEVAKLENLNPHDVLGSSAGAIGLPQFLPGNVKTFGIDGNKDGIIDLTTPSDAIFSVANFLSKHGWEKEIKDHSKKRSVVWEYNRSDSYIDTVLTMSKELESRVTQIRYAKSKKAPLANSAANVLAVIK